MISIPPTSRTVPITWTIWFAWVLVAALGPVLYTISATAFGKQISRNAEYGTLIAIALVPIMALVLAPPIMQGLVLKRIMPKLSVTLWFLCILVSGIVWLALTQVRPLAGRDLIEAGIGAQRQLQRAASTARGTGALNTSQILSLPWGPFLLWTIALNALTSLVPAVILGAASRKWRAPWLFLAASIAGACASGIVEQVYAMTIDRWPRRDWALNGLSWTDRFQILAFRGGVGAVWGAVTAMVVMLMTRRSHNAKVPATRIFALHRLGGSALVLIAPLLITLLAPLAGYLAGPDGIVIGAPELRKALSLAPWRDRSQGETILAYSHTIAVPVGRIAAAAIAPDGQTVIVRTVDHTLMQVDITTGRSLRQLADALAPSEPYSIAWSPDGRYLALRSNGAEVPLSNTRYTKHQTRVRLYLLPDLKLAGEFSGSEATCIDSYTREPMLFASDSNSLWMACGQSSAQKPDDLMAIRLNVPATQVLDIRRYGQAAESGPTRGLERIGDSVWAWQFSSGGTSFRIRDLTHDREIVAVQTPTLLIGSLTEQTGSSQVDEKTIRLNFCGVPPGAPAGAGSASQICRTLTFDTMTGALIGSADQSDHRISVPPVRTLSGHGLRIDAFWRIDSKTGELVVHDSVSGRERQRIISVAQQPLQMSADGRWLLTLGIYGGDLSLRLYRIQL